jgi:hypothetical protein
VCKEGQQDQYGGVNMALGGYLHSTIYSPASKAKSHNQKFQNSALYRQYSAGGSVQHNSNDVWKRYKDNNNNNNNNNNANNNNKVSNFDLPHIKILHNTTIKRETIKNMHTPWGD